MVVSGSGVQQHFGSANNLHREQFGSITSLASSTSLISQQVCYIHYYYYN